MLDAHIIESCLDGNECPITLDVRASVDSTNDIAKQAAEQGKQTGYCCIASEQIKGKGQRGKEFFSPPDSGVYFSLLIRPHTGNTREVHYTTLTAIAVARAINEIAGQTAHIKWVNDVYVGSRKVCGILTEAHTNASGICDYVVIGIGINVFNPADGWPTDLADKAGAVFSSESVYPDAREQIVALTIRAVFELLNEDNDVLVSAYRELCPLQDKIVTIEQTGFPARKARVVGINDDFTLGVCYLEDGTTRQLYSSGVSITE